MEETRAFICIDFPSEVVKEIARVQGLLENKKFTGKLTELGNLHLTLKFLGEVTTERLGEVKKVLSGVDFGRFEAGLGGAGTFSFKGMPRIVWVKVSGMFDLQEKIDLALEKIGFRREARFMSHLTLARVKYVKDKQGFREYVKGVSVKSLGWEVRNFKLKSSELGVGGAVYETLKNFRLK